MGLNENDVGKLEDAASIRKQKLLALKNRKNKTNLQSEEESKDESLPQTQVLFRNYKPLTEKLEEAVLPQAEPDNVENLIKEQLQHEESGKVVADVEMSSLAPKKLTFDLQRGIQAQLDKLEKRTDKAIAELIRERLKEGKMQDFLIAVDSGASTQQTMSLDSDED